MPTLQLSDILPEVYSKLGHGVVSKATDGSTSTLVDTALPAVVNNNNRYKGVDGGAIMVIEDAGGASAAPEGEFARFSSLTTSSGTFNLTDTLTAAPAAGDIYMFVNNEYPILEVVERVNEALVSLGEIDNLNTSQDAVASQTLYTLPAGVVKVTRVELETDKDDSNDPRYIPLDGWREVPAAGGSQHSIYIPQVVEDYNFRIWYNGLHPRVSAYSDSIHAWQSKEVVVRRTVELCKNWKANNMPNNKNFQLYRDAQSETERAEQRNPKKKARVQRPRFDAGDFYRT